MHRVHHPCLCQYPKIPRKNPKFFNYQQYQMGRTCSNVEKQHSLQVGKSYLLHFLQKSYNVSSQFLQFFICLPQFELSVVVLLLHSFGSGIRSALVRVTQRLETRLILLEILFLHRNKYQNETSIRVRLTNFVSIMFSFFDDVDVQGLMGRL